MRTPPLSPADASLNLPLPRPPAWIWLFTTQTGPPSSFAATSASAGSSTATPFEMGTPNSCSSALAWYSWMFIGRSQTSEFAPVAGLRSAAEQVRRDLLASIHKTLHRADRFIKTFPVLAGEFDLDNALDPFGSDHHGNADIHVLDAVFAAEIGRARQHALLVAQIAFRHGDRRRRRRIKGRTGFQQVDDLGAAIAGPVDDLIDARLRGPTH